MDISGSLGTFSSCLRFYIDEFDRIFVHVSSNLPALGNQIEKQVVRIKELSESGEEESVVYSNLLVDLSDVRIPIFEIIIELQKQDIIYQQMNHLADAVDNVSRIALEYSEAFDKIDERKEDEPYRDEYRHLLTLVSFLLNNLEKQMNHINRELNDMVDSMEEKFSGIHTRISILRNERKVLAADDGEIFRITDNLYNELELYEGFFARLTLLKGDLDRELNLCINMNREVRDYENILGGFYSLDECRFGNTVIQEIVDKLSVEQERDVLRREYGELHIEESFTRDVVLF